MSLLDLFGGKPKDPKEQAREWKSSLRKDVRKVERTIQDLQNEEKKAIAEMKKAAKATNDVSVLKILAKNLCMIRGQVKRQFLARTQLNSVSMQIDEQMAQLKVMKAFSVSAQAMKMMGSLMKLPEIKASMMTLSKEMQKAGFVEEMMSEGIDDAMGDANEAEVDEVTAKMMNETLGADLASAVIKGADLKVAAKKQDVKQADPEEEEMEKRLKKLQTE